MHLTFSLSLAVALSMMVTELLALAPAAVPDHSDSSSRDP
jgi:hypothetical protein